MINTKKIHPVKCEDLVRIGRENDGGYIVPNKIFSLSNVLLSYGINKDWSFEKDFIKKNPKVQIHCYDHTLNLSGLVIFTIKSILLILLHTLILILCLTIVLPLINGRLFSTFLTIKRLKRNLYGIFIIPDYYLFFRKNVTHYKNRIWHNNEQNSKTVQQTISSIDILERNIFIKMDIEKAEYQVFDGIFESAKNISGIVVEFHDLENHSEKFEEIIDRSKPFFNIVHVHGNNYSKLLKNQDFPSAIEITFLHKRYSDNTELSSKSYPIEELDQPNKISRPDYKLVF